MQHGMFWFTDKQIKFVNVIYPSCCFCIGEKETFLLPESSKFSFTNWIYVNICWWFSSVVCLCDLDLGIKSAVWPYDSPAGLLAAGTERRRKLWGFPWVSGGWMSGGCIRGGICFPSSVSPKDSLLSFFFPEEKIQTAKGTDLLWQLN